MSGPGLQGMSSLESHNLNPALFVAVADFTFQNEESRFRYVK